MSLDVKICGLTTAAATDAALAGGAFAVGFVFFTASPRAVPPSTARDLAARAADRALRFGLFVDPDDALLETVLDQVPLDGIQLHGQETPARVEAVRATFGLPIMKAIAISTGDDVVAADAYRGVVDWLLFDSRPPKDATRPGGNAQAFDWSLLAGQPSTTPWLLAGGLDVDNLATAVAASGARAVDVSSGVESTPGRKSVEKIRAFLALASELGAPSALNEQG